MSKTKLTRSSKPLINEVRPIGARVLKSAIDSLRPYLFEASVLDLFAGQGRFGITTSEEGISCVTFVEKDRQTTSELRSFVSGRQFPKNVKATILCQDVFTFLENSKETFDVVFADPPFPLWNKDFENRLFTAVIKALKPGSIFLVKHPSRMLPCSQLGELTQMKLSDFGESRLIYFKYEAQ